MKIRVIIICALITVMVVLVFVIGVNLGLQISDVKLERAIEEEPRSTLPPLMEADSDESESLRKVTY